MTRVDSEGRVLLPEGIQDRLNMTPGTEVAVREEGRKVVIEPETSPDKILERLEQMIKEISPRQKVEHHLVKRTVQPLTSTKMLFSDVRRATVMSDTGDLYLFDAGASLPIGNRYATLTTTESESITSEGFQQSRRSGNI